MYNLLLKGYKTKLTQRIANILVKLDVNVKYSDVYLIYKYISRYFYVWDLGIDYMCFLTTIKVILEMQIA